MDRTPEEIVLVRPMATNDENELSNERRSNRRLFQWKKVFILWILLLMCLFVVAGPLSLRISYAIPSVKKREIAFEIFSEERARDYLNNLTRYGSRASYTRGNFQARNYLLTQIKRIFSSSKRNLRLQFDLQNLTDFNHHQLQNILVRVSNPTIKSKNVSSLMLAAHYDSVEFSPGACDDGSGVVVLLELLSNLINDLTITFTDVHLVVLLTNAEELGSQGAEAFIAHHPWRFNIHRFIYIDAASCNEKAALIRLKPSKLIFDYGRVSRPHANAILQDILQWIGLKADYDSYILNGSLSGYEFGFLVDGYFYHTPLDTVSNIKEGVLQDLGDNLGVLVRHILQGNIEEDIEENSLIYFDILGRYLFVYKMSTSIIIQRILILSIIIIGVCLIIVDEISHRKRSSSCPDECCIYFSFRRAFRLRVSSIILYFFSNILSMVIGFLFSMSLAWIISIVRPLSWFGSSTLATFIFSLPCFIGSITNTYFWDAVHQFILRKWSKNSSIGTKQLKEIPFDFEQNFSVLCIYGLMMIISVCSLNRLFYLILIWSIFICPIYLLLMIMEFILHWKEVHWRFFEQRYHWLFLPLIISLFPLIHTIEITDRLVRILIPLLAKRFSFGSWALYGNLIICSIIAVPTLLLTLIFLPIFQRIKCFGRTLIVLLVSFSIILIVAYYRQPFTHNHPHVVYAKHTSKSIFKVQRLFNLPLNVPLQSQSSLITMVTYDGHASSLLLEDFSAKSGYLLHNKRCLNPTNCRFDDTFNRTIAVQSIQIESMKNFTNYTIRIEHVRSYHIRISSSPFFKFLVRNEWMIPRTETVVDVISNSTLHSFDLDIEIKRCDLTDSPFLLLFTRFMPNFVPVGKGQCQLIDDDAILIFDLSAFFN